MENVLMRLCRLTHCLSTRQVAAKLEITPGEYTQLETGELTLTSKQAKHLAEIYNIKAKYFQEAAQQLELLLTQKQIIKDLKSENESLNHLMEKGYDFIHNGKMGKETVAV